MAIRVLVQSHARDQAVNDIIVIVCNSAKAFHFCNGGNDLGQ